MKLGPAKCQYNNGCCLLTQIQQLLIKYIHLRTQIHGFFNLHDIAQRRQEVKATNFPDQKRWPNVSYYPKFYRVALKFFDYIDLLLDLAKLRLSILSVLIFPLQNFGTNSRQSEVISVKKVNTSSSAYLDKLARQSKKEPESHDFSDLKFTALVTLTISCDAIKI